MLTNGSTAMECGGGVKAAGAALAGATGGVGGDARCLEIQNLSATKYASTARTATVTHSPRFDHESPRIGRRVLSVASDTEDAVGCAVGARSCAGDRRRHTRSAKAGGVSPAGRRVHCTR